MQHAVEAVHVMGDLTDLAADEAVRDRTAPIARELDDLAAVDGDRQAAQVGAVERARAGALFHRRTMTDHPLPLESVCHRLRSAPARFSVSRAGASRPPAPPRARRARPQAPMP